MWTDSPSAAKRLQRSGCAMVGSRVSSAMAESEIAALKETLQTQQQLLQKVYKELEEERESSAIAASEALSMILRLQGERAAEKMEASQYKRLVEEKMHYAVECLSVFEGLMYSKEMEITSLVFQVEAYRYKLQSLGFTDPSVGKLKFPDNQYLRRKEVQMGKLGLPGVMRRYNSLPPIPLKDAQAKTKVGNEGSATPLQDLIAGKNDEETQVVSEESVVGDFNSYSEKIKRLDEWVKELSNRRVVERVDSNLISRNHDISSIMAAFSTLMGASRTCSLSKAVSRNLPLDPTGGATTIKMDSEGTSSCSTLKAKDSDGFLGFDASGNPCLKSETIRSSIHSTTVHDHENNKFCVSQKREQKKLIFKDGTRLGKQESVPPETSEFYFKEKDEWIKKVLLYHGKKFPRPRDGVTLDYHSPLSDSNFDVSPFQSEIMRLKKRLEPLEDDRRIIKQEASNREEEQLRLLREINEQLNVIQSEIDHFKSKKSPLRDESQLLSFIERMLCCSL
ncbi:uncharacterized protein LOC122082531 isoform X2 [Macadamia integrifolia]|uniref:uncharacterized protein LOC122082531 isoform X2 n=1 Tax=Macadamia integrifolia TaxID=60698 RepID=UPI001C5006A3|nr:uncharacterized protein LOC122082531 isoform X2 [Macadamia integrifolia]